MQNVRTLQERTFDIKKGDPKFFTLRKGGDKVCGGAADELHKVAIGCMAAAETDIKIEVFVVLRRIQTQLCSHIADALPVHIVIERHAGVLPDATGHIDAVGTNGRAQRLDRSVRIAPYLPLVHHLAYHRPEVEVSFVCSYPVTHRAYLLRGCFIRLIGIRFVLRGWKNTDVTLEIIEVEHHKSAP